MWQLEETFSFYHSVSGLDCLEFRARVWKCSYDEFISLQFTSISRRSSDCPHVSKSSRAWHQKLSSWSSMPSAGVWLANLQQWLAWIRHTQTDTILSKTRATLQPGREEGLRQRGLEEQYPQKCLNFGLQAAKLIKQNSWEEANKEEQLMGASYCRINNCFIQYFSTVFENLLEFNTCFLCQAKYRMRKI